MFKPVNRHILVDYSPPEAKPESGILLPDDYVAPTEDYVTCLLYTSPSPRDATLSRMPSSA